MVKEREGAPGSAVRHPGEVDSAGQGAEAVDGERRRRLGGVAHGGRRGGRPGDHGSVASGGRARAARFRAKPGARRPIRPFPGGLPSPEYGRREREVREMVSGSFVIRPKFQNPVL